jgi:hypothetical protein
MLAMASPEALAVVPTAPLVLLVLVLVLLEVVLVDVLLARSPPPDVLTATEGDGA